MSAEEKLKQEFLEVFSKHSDAVKCELATAFAREDDEPKFGFGLLSLVLKEFRSDEDTWDYGSFVLQRRSTDFKTGLQVVNSLFSKTPINFPGHGDFAFARRTSEVDYIPSRRTYSLFRPDWSTKHMEFVCEGDKSQKRTRKFLQMKGLRLFPDDDEAIRSFFRLETNRDYQLDRGRFDVLVPDFRARIDEFRIGYTKLEMKVSVKLSSLDQIAAKFYVRGIDEEVSQSDEIPFSSNAVTYDFGFEPDKILALLVDKTTGEPIDERDWRPAWPDQYSDVVLDRPEEQIRDYISRGENKRVEFKAKLDREDFLETVIAFSNTEGGIIILGVNDNGIPLGFEGDEESIAKRIRDTCEPLIEPDFSHYTLDEKPVLVVEIAQGTNKPYLRKYKGTIYIRVGPNDEPATRADIDDLLKGTQNSYGPGRHFIGTY